MTSQGIQKPCPVCDGLAIRPYRHVSRTYAGTPYDLFLCRCDDCGFVFLANDPHIEYDAAYLNLEQVIAEDELARFRARERIAGIARLVPPAPERQFLDIGIGDGLLLSLVASAGYAAFGLDVNPASIELARTRCRSRAEIRLGLPEQAFPDHRFDVIHMNEVIEHISEPMPLLCWCYDHLTAGGWLVIQTGNLDSLACRLMGANWDYFRPMHVSYFSTRTLCRAVGRAGFKVVRVSTADWRFRPSMRMAWRLMKRQGARRAPSFLSLYLTLFPHGLRRIVLVHATPDGGELLRETTAGLAQRGRVERR